MIQAWIIRIKPLLTMVFTSQCVHIKIRFAYVAFIRSNEKVLRKFEVDKMIGYANFHTYKCHKSSPQGL